MTLFHPIPLRLHLKDILKDASFTIFIFEVRYFMYKNKRIINFSTFYEQRGIKNLQCHILNIQRRNFMLHCVCFLLLMIDAES